MGQIGQFEVLLVGIKTLTLLTFVVDRNSALLLVVTKGITTSLNRDIHHNSKAIRNWGQLVDLLLHTSTHTGITFG